MLRKTLSLVTLIAATLLLFGQQTISRADSFYASALTSTNGGFALYVMGGASGNASSADGWICVVNSDGSWIDGQIVALDVQPGKKGGVTSKVTFFGWYEDWMPGWYELNCTQTARGSTISLNGGGDSDMYAGFLYLTK